ncbi:uncharacterized protein LOC135372422 [Ornithodoros turicata]|uniref:uncharacterized protein LOC135372422 n=1 Tax=Ornithodoros turicata TaxID=34597 RepID=UPI00313A42F2
MELKRRQCPLESVARVPRTTGCTRHSPCAGHWTTFCGRTGAEFSGNHEVRSFQKSIQFLQSVTMCSLAWTLSVVLPWMDNHPRVFLEEHAKTLESHACFVPLRHNVELRFPILCNTSKTLRLRDTIQRHQFACVTVTLYYSLT